ncbi:hypothetical protein QBC46DRAFT_376579 [Diplogelasinospora grovesii]|uniref:Wax synthase domain-containing protein n=1 Tax=Diplogelasinospora grovesii TaxID=303347 RepID=A0AAN6S866_9PEZI|nr:hypothetical protein QBC46DRAFT_376579 [Diplogelasinospora grovesii]
MDQGQLIKNLAAVWLETYRAQFRTTLANGEIKPFVIPYTLFGAFFLPVLYLSIPHRNRPWLYRLRWVVAAAMVWFNVRTMQTTSSTSMAVAYATGLMAAWGTIWGLTVVVFMEDVQVRAARVDRRPRQHSNGGIRDGSANGHAQDGNGNGMVRNGNGTGHVGNGNGNGHIRVTTEKGERLDKEAETETKGKRRVWVDESVAAVINDHEYYWQPFPETGSFMERLGWVCDLYTSFRGTGWNWAVRTISTPHFSGFNSPVNLSIIPLVTRTGCSRSTTYRSFFVSRLWHITWSWLVLDLWTLVFRRDPYFIVGPEYARQPFNYPLPSFLAPPLPRSILSLFRSLGGFSGTLAGLFFYMYFYQLLLISLSLLFPGWLGVRGQLWQYPSIFGSFDNIYDKGLAGFWGGWWHQTFRTAFTAPTAFLVRNRLLPHPEHTKYGKVTKVVVEGAVAFLQSGLLHASGGFTAVSDRTWFWGPVVFFMSSFLGILLQTAFCAVFKHQIQRLPRTARRGGNLVFVVLWLHFTCWALVDDMSRAGLWMFEPVPFSPLRLLGIGWKDDMNPWRWDMEYCSRWYTGRNWWESGIRL